MTDPISFTSTSPRYALPFLFSGQSQKEITVNEAHALVDALLHPAIEGESAAPPGSPSEGECWIVGAGASGDWAGHDGEMACFEAGNWLFITPRDGMRLLDKSADQLILYHGGWQVPAAIADPAGGATVDTEARAAIAAIVDALELAGVLPAS